MIAADQPTIFPSNVKVAVSSNSDGSMKFGQDQSDEQTAENLVGLAEKIGLTKDQVAGIHITYTDDGTYDVIKEVEPASRFDITDRSTWVDCDALVTTSKNIGMLIPIADCNGVVMYDPEHELLALAHIGWHAAAADLPRKLIQHLISRHQSDPSKLLVYISPSIRVPSYVQTSPSQLQLPDWNDYLAKTDAGFQIDVFGFVNDQMLASGVSPANVEASSADVAQSANYPSHFRDKATNPKTARFAVICALA